MMGGPGTATTFFIPAAADSKKPQVIIAELDNKDDPEVKEPNQKKLKLGNFEGGFMGEVNFPQADFASITKIFKETATWESMFKLVELRFLDRMAEIKKNAASTGQSTLEKLPIIYEISEIIENDKEFIVKIRMKDCEENKQSKIYFTKFEAEFKFAKTEQGAKFSLDMRYERNLWWAKRKIQDSVLDIKKVMRKALTHALTTAHTRIFDPQTFFEKQKFEAGLTFNTNPQLRLKDGILYYAKGVKATWASVPVTKDAVYKVLNDPARFAKLYPTFIVNPKDPQKLAIPFLDDLTRVEFHYSKNDDGSIMLESKGLTPSGQIKIYFYVQEDQYGKPNVIVDFEYHVLKPMSDDFTLAINQLAKIMQNTMLRHLDIELKKDLQQRPVSAVYGIPAAAVPTPAP